MNVDKIAELIKEEGDFYSQFVLAKDYKDSPYFFFTNCKEELLYFDGDPQETDLLFLNFTVAAARRFKENLNTVEEICGLPKSKKFLEFKHPYGVLLHVDSPFWKNKIITLDILCLIYRFTKKIKDWKSLKKQIEEYYIDWQEEGYDRENILYFLYFIKNLKKETEKITNDNYERGKSKCSQYRGYRINGSISAVRFSKQFEPLRNKVDQLIDKVLQ